MLNPSRHALFLLASLCVQAQLIGISSGVASSSSTAAPSTCPSRSINYITQTLPQQCFTSSWACKVTTTQQEAIDGAQITSSDFGILTPANGNVNAANPTVQASLETGFSTSASTSSQGPGTINQVPDDTLILPAIEAKIQTEAASRVAQQNEVDAALDNANFLSFEDWKRQNLAKVGQSADSLGARGGNAVVAHRRRPGGINNALDSLGEDSEIDIDFGGFVNPGAIPSAAPAQGSKSKEVKSITPEEFQEGHIAEDLSNVRRRSTDAGKTCKERSNYASFDCAATALKSNPECKGSTAVLVENKDSYMLNTCFAKNKFLIVELCDDILIDTVVLANFEFFSSMFRTFKVSVSDRYPVKLEKWIELGKFEARNSREVQAFLVENPRIWARYLRIEFLTHFGSEYYCPVSLLRVHGTTMMEEFNHDVKGSRGEEENEGDIEEAVDRKVFALGPEAIDTEAPTQTAPEQAVTTVLSPITETSTSKLVVSDTSSEILAAIPLSDPSMSSPKTCYDSSIGTQLKELLRSKNIGTQICMPEERPEEVGDEMPTLTTTVDRLTETSEVAKQVLVTTTSENISRTSHTASINTTACSEPLAPKRSVSDIPHNKTIVSGKEVNQTAAGVGRAPTSSTHPASANPTTQESFFKSVHKRLQLLESNSTLSLQYIEEQSRILRDAFSKVEKRQLMKTSTFLESLNTTMLMELREFRMQYDQIWQSTVLELSSQREKSHHEMLALSTRLSLLADEIVFQKRMAVLQFVLILLCLGVVIFSRYGSAASDLEFPPLPQNAINRSSVRPPRTPTLQSPFNSPSSTRPSSRYALFQGLRHTRSPSEKSDLKGGTKSPNVEFSPLTPESHLSSRRDASAYVDSRDELSDGLLEGPESDENAARETKSSPATLYGNREEY